MLSCRPTAALRPFIRYYYQVAAISEVGAAVQPVPARSPQAIEFTFGTPFEVKRLDRPDVRKAYPVALIGAQTYRRVDLVMRGNVDAFTIVFQPGGLSAMFSLPAATITNEDFDGEAVLGAWLGELARQLGDEISFAERVRIADRYLCARRPPAELASGISRAAKDLHVSGGCLSVSELAQKAGLGARQFGRRFRDEIGIAPKLYARIVRFETALRCKAAAPARRWADIAHSLGYYDQMHMVHDFNRLSSDSPTAIGSRLDMFVRPEIASGSNE